MVGYSDHSGQSQSEVSLGSFIPVFKRSRRILHAS